MNGIRSRAWCFTTFAGAVPNGDLDAYAETLKTCTCRWLVVGKETCPETQRRHLQGAVWFANAKTLSAVRSIIQGNLTRANGSAAENREYCTKEGNSFEIGNMPIDQKEKGRLGAYVLFNLVKSGTHVGR